MAEFHEKLQELRKQRGLTQEELAELLFVSRTAISKWESGRGFPSIESLKAISACFSVSLDDLLSGDELLTIAEEDHKQRETHLKDMLFGLLDCCVTLFWFLPFFGQTLDDSIASVSLLSLTDIQPWLKIAYIVIVVSMTLCGVLLLALQNCRATVWTKNKYILSVMLNVISVCLFILSRQPYATMLVFAFLVIKLLIVLKRQ